MYKRQVLDDAAFVFKVGRDVDGGVCHQQRFGVGWHVHDVDMAEPFARAQAGLRGGNGVQEFVGVQGAFHQQLGLAGAHQFHRAGGGIVAVGGGLDGEAGNVDVMRGGDGADFFCRADQDGGDKPGLRGFHGGQQGDFVTRVGDGGGQRRAGGNAAEQAAQMLSLIHI